MINLLIPLLVLVAIFAVIWWGLSQIPLPEPLRIVVVVMLVIVALLVLVQLLPIDVRGLR